VVASPNSYFSKQLCMTEHMLVVHLLIILSIDLLSSTVLFSLYQVSRLDESSSFSLSLAVCVLKPRNKLRLNVNKCQLFFCSNYHQVMRNARCTYWSPFLVNRKTIEKNFEMLTWHTMAFNNVYLVVHLNTMNES
jgi:hypothetical protein